MAERILVLRTPSGLSGDMLVAGLAGLAGLDAAGFADALAAVGLPELVGAAAVVPKNVDGIAGLGLRVTLPQAHEHRHLADIRAVIQAGGLAQSAKDAALRAFELLAEAEAAVHGASPEEVHFHEVGALDSILDVCLACELFARLAPDRFVCSPLPVCDGAVRCAHGLLATPAPAVLRLLAGIPVYGIESSGETVTPTAVAVLKALGATFGPWPALVLDRHVRAYGNRTVPGVPNGAVFALGRSFDRAAPDPGHGHAHDHAPSHSHPGDA